MRSMGRAGPMSEPSRPATSAWPGSSPGETVRRGPRCPFLLPTVPVGDTLVPVGSVTGRMSRDGTGWSIPSEQGKRYEAVHPGTPQDPFGRTHNPSVGGSSPPRPTP
jgi:hypothetical protein